MRSLLLTAAAATMVATASTAIAAGAISPGAGEVMVQAKRDLAMNQRLVRYGDLNLKAEAGQRALRTRVGMAIASLCDVSNFSVTDPTGSMKCHNAAWADVQPTLVQLAAR